MFLGRIVAFWAPLVAAAGEGRSGSANVAGLTTPVTPAHILVSTFQKMV
jgi:hypothetical protein